MNNPANSFALSAAWLALLCLQGSAQESPPVPDPTHITFILPKDLKWEGNPDSGQVHVNFVGDPAKPGLYVRLAKWLRGHYSRPHYHDILRYFYVTSGTWWVSSSTTYDPSKTYPMRAGTWVEDLPNKAHFDGAKDEPGVILEIGIGPMKSTACKTPADCP